MRIVYLHQYFNTPDMVGGTRSYEMARRLVAWGHEVHMVTSWREPTDKLDWFSSEEAGIQVHWLPVHYSNHMGYSARIRAFLKFAWGAARKAASLPADVVFATSTPLTIALPGIYASRRQKVPMVFEVRDLWPEVPIALGALKSPLMIRLAHRLERIAYNHSSRVVALAPGMKKGILKSGYPAEKVLVIPNGCDFDVFGNKMDMEIPSLMNNERPLLVYAGAMGLANGVEFIVKVAGELKKKPCKNMFRFVLIGDGGHRQKAETLAKTLGLSEDELVFLGPLPKREVASWMNLAIATLMTYDGPEVIFRDSVSNKFFDSLAAGKPVIANFSGFSTEIARDCGAGFIISRDPIVAASELLDLADNLDVLVNAGRCAKDLAKERFSRDYLAGQLEQVLMEAVGDQ